MIRDEGNAAKHGDFSSHLTLERLIFRDFFPNVVLVERFLCGGFVK